MTIKLTDIRLYYHDLKHDGVFVWTSRIVLASLLLSLTFLLITWNQLPRQVPLFYSLPWGEEQLADPLALIILLFAAGGVYCFNTALGIFVKQKWYFFMYILLFGGVIFTLFAIITVMRIVLLLT